MSKSKYARSLCCWFGCENKATIRYATPGYNKKNNEEQLFCDAHWKQVAQNTIDPSRIKQIQEN